MICGQVGPRGEPLPNLARTQVSQNSCSIMLIALEHEVTMSTAIVLIEKDVDTVFHASWGTSCPSRLNAPLPPPRDIGMGYVTNSQTPRLLAHMLVQDHAFCPAPSQALAIFDS